MTIAGAVGASSVMASAPGAQAPGAGPPQPQGPGGAGPPYLSLRAGSSTVFPQRGGYCWAQEPDHFCVSSVYGPYGRYKPGPRETLKVRPGRWVFVYAGTAVNTMEVTATRFRPAIAPYTAGRDRWRFRAPAARARRVLQVRLAVGYPASSGSGVPYFFRLDVQPPGRVSQ
jgi:hypothetical protein